MIVSCSSSTTNPVDDGTETIDTEEPPSILGEVTIPESVVKIGSGAFSNSPELKQITIHSSVKTIGDNAFSSCLELITVIYKGTSPDTLKNDTAFLYCNKLTTLILPNV